MSTNSKQASNGNQPVTAQPGTAEAGILVQLRHLRNQGGMPRSQCGRSLLHTLRPLLDAGVVAEERSGAGRRLAVRNPTALEDFIRREFPDVQTPPGTSSRVAGVARFRDSKSLPGDTPEIVCVRAWDDAALCREGEPVYAARMTSIHGVMAFLLDPLAGYNLSGRCALVENPALFTVIERLNLSLDLAIHGGGRVSHRLLEWLAGQTQTAAGFSLLHLPDYDPVGLSEFVRLRERLGARVALHLPPDLDQRFNRFASRALLDKPNSRVMLARLRDSQSPEVRQVVALIDRHNAGLEQEALFL